MRRMMICLLLLACATPLWAQMGMGIQPGAKMGSSFEDLAREQRVLIGNYCRADFEGARLSDDGWRKIRPYTALRENPEFKSIFVVARYQVLANPNPTASNSIDVNYLLLGRYEEGMGYVPMSGTRRGSYETKTFEGAMRVRNMEPTTPFVSRRAAVEWLKGKLAKAESGSPERKLLENAISQLEAPPEPASQPQPAAPRRPTPAP